MSNVVKQTPCSLYFSSLKNLKFECTNLTIQHEYSLVNRWTANYGLDAVNFSFSMREFDYSSIVTARKNIFVLEVLEKFWLLNLTNLSSQFTTFPSIISRNLIVNFTGTIEELVMVTQQLKEKVLTPYQKDYNYILSL